MLTDKIAIIQVIGSLMKNPSFLNENDKYWLAPDDFDTSFYRNIFITINNLYQNGVVRVTPLDINNYLETKPSVFQKFKENNGMEFLQDCEDLSTVENFDYYYTRIKKLNCLKEFKRQGFSIDEIYREEITDRTKEINEAFDNMSVNDVIDYFKGIVSNIDLKYKTNGVQGSSNASDGIVDLLDELEKSPNVGANLPGHILNTVVRGARKGTFYLKSAESGAGKSRSMVGDACYMAYPIRYNNRTKLWEWCGGNEKVLYIATEQNKDEIQTMVLSYLTGLNEEKLIDSRFTPEEKELYLQAAEVMKYYENNLEIVKIADPSIAKIKALVRSYYYEKNIDNVFYDYIFSSPGLLNEFRDLKIREDVALLNLSSALKDLSTELDIFVCSGTQLNRNGDNNSLGVKNQNNIRGALSIVDKCDFAYIFSRVGNEELQELLEAQDGLAITPNQVTDIYKIRRGRFNNVRIWSYFDYGNCRKTDLLITDGHYKVIEDFQPKIYINDEFLDSTILEQLNNKTLQLINSEKQEKIAKQIELDEEGYFF